jgi:4'-phosphopantetheinyl transferase
MQSVLLDTPAGIIARLGWDPKMSDHDRKRALAKEIVAGKYGLEEREVRVERELPEHFGFHTQLVAEVGREPVPLSIRNASFRAATVVVVYDPAITVGIDLRDSHPDETTLKEMRRHSHLFDEDNVPKLLAHWTRVQAVRDADGRGTRIKGEHVRLDTPLTKGWIPDRPVFYQLVDLSREGWIITLAHVATAP